MPLDCAGYLDLFEDEATELPPSSSLVKVENEKTGPPVPLTEDEEWQNDPVSVKLEKIRGVFLNAKTAPEVRAAASTMAIGDWLDMVGKLNKQVDPAPVHITAIRIELPPRQECDGDVVEVELAS